MYAEEIWKGDTLVVDLEELQEMDASEVCAARLNAQEVIFPKSGENYMFLVEDGTVKPCGEDPALRTSILIRKQPVRGESHQDFFGESEGSPPTTHFQDSFPDGGESLNDLWSIS